MEKVAVLGASNNPERYSNKAVNLLLEYGHEVYPIHPTLDKVSNLKVYKSINDITDKIDTLTVYINPKVVESQIDDILKLNPRRIIFNPGTESDQIISLFEEKGLKVVRGCTLVMLKTNQY